jgi:hypothetical protein
MDSPGQSTLMGGKPAKELLLKFRDIGDRVHNYRQLVYFIWCR